MPSTRRLRISWSDDAKVTGLMAGPSEGPIGVLLAHGAGAGQGHPFMVGLRRRLAAADVVTLSFDYPYMEEGRRAPDRLERLIACHRAVFARLADRVDGIVLAGKSMGGRVGGHLVAEQALSVAGLVFYGYPLIPLGKSEPRSMDHLEGVDAPMLFLQGSRDRMGSPDALAAVTDRIPRAVLRTVADADHGFRVPKRTGLGEDDVLDLLADETVRFVTPLAERRTLPS